LAVTAVLGAGPAGLAAAWELSAAGRSVALFDREGAVGGLCRSFDLEGCVFDVGPHLFKPRRAEVGALWDRFCDDGYAPAGEDAACLYFGGGLHRSNADAILDQPWRRVIKMGGALAARLLRPLRVASAEDLLRNLRGDAIYRDFYRPREEKFWGDSLTRIDPSFYATQAVDPRVVIARRLGLGGGAAPRAEPEVPARYPKSGAGRLYGRLAEALTASGFARICLDAEVVRLVHAGGRVRAVISRDTRTGEEHEHAVDDVISTIPLKALVRSLQPGLSGPVLDAAARLRHRDLVTVNLVLSPEVDFPADRIDVFSDDVEVYRVTRFRGLAGTSGRAERGVPVCLEYYCFADDASWRRDDASWGVVARHELEQIAGVDASRVLASSVQRLREACPIQQRGYRGWVAVILDALAGFENLQSVGRNGLFSYNQMSHSMECGLLAARNVLGEDHRIVPPGAGESVVF
jgi:protoporphyrinogen oxidase